ncbi:cytochrome-c oxidase, cbb3-type subunit III [Plastorhodobacter daqingensis]|uniref:Cbb3-type cytochrome c oxidase subunit n=1 Tax=Plastorhodobacter daqingensis TaxID=1387281 RepID=A0ABW2UNH1_9RHOB
MVDKEDRVPENKVQPAERQYPDPKRVLKRKKVGEVQTTGHTWDGIEEYDNPMPRWWLWTFYATIIWAIAYMIAFPAWPLIRQATPGLLGYSTRANVQSELESFEARNAEWFERLVSTDLTEIHLDEDLNRFAVSAGAAVFRTHCSQCHGSGAAGVQASGYPNLLDDDWLWGGDIEEIHTTVAHGIRNETDPDARWSQMPAFGDMLPREEIDAVVHHVLALSGQDHDRTLARAGAEVFYDNCASCHGEGGEGDRFQGAPRLNDAIWLYGGSEDAIRHTVSYSRFGVMPAFSERIRESEIRAVALYVHQLGGGE